MESVLQLKVLLLALTFICSTAAENDWNLCGSWRHGVDPLTLAVDVSTGCHTLSVSANGSTLSVGGRFTAHCRRLDVIQLSGRFPVDPTQDTPFCLFWEPSLDQLKLQIGEHTLSLCWPKQLLDKCCSELSPAPFNEPERPFGISDTSVMGDPISAKTLHGYTFQGTPVAYTTLCEEWGRTGARFNRIGDTPCPRTSILDPRGTQSVVNFTESVSAEPSVVVRIPPTFQLHVQPSSKVVVTSFKNNSWFQPSHSATKVIEDVVEISAGNQVVANLSEPVCIHFHHHTIQRNYSRSCVSWDTNKDPLQVNWLLDGCETLQHGAAHTECRCSHLTYFSILVQLEPRPVRHLLALTAITSLGCAVSLICCVALIIHLCMKSRRSKEQSAPVHLGLTLSLATLYLLFFCSPILANAPGGEHTCLWVAPMLHYALLASLTWMGVEVCHSFWLVCVVLSPAPRPLVWYLIGFALPAAPVFILVSVGGIYGLREVHQEHDPADPYRMCWMTGSPQAMLAHYCTTMMLLALVFCSGLVMLGLVYRQIRYRNEWRQQRMAFFSMWGLSCLFGTSWCLAFLDFGFLSTPVLFLFCILNSFQGLLLLLRFCLLAWLGRQSSSSFSYSSSSSFAGSSSSSSSTRQRMMPLQEKC